jgi:hypothetical protein
MGLKRAILVLGEPQTLTAELERLERDGPFAIVQEPWPGSRTELVKILKALTEHWGVEAILLLGGYQFKPLNEEIFGPFMPALRLVCGIAAGW